MHTLSLAEFFTIRNRAFTEISRHTAAIDAITAGIADMDVALQSSIAERNVDELQAVISAARRLSAALEMGAE